MTLGAADTAFARELFSDLPDLTSRRMFGGLAFYSEGTIFALMLSDGKLMIKAQQGPFAERLAALGCEKWVYTRKDGASSSMPYWSLPDAALDDPAYACALARDALAAQT